jgi:hypothetical protein
MQPKLQKRVRGIFERVANVNQILVATHSPNMIDIYNPGNVKLFYLEAELKPYKRKLKRSFYKKKTSFKCIDDTGFVDELRNHFGVEINDGWILKNKNILFEGIDDEAYFHSTFKSLMGYQLDTANIICNGVGNMPSFASLLSQQIAEEKLADGSLICLLDDDTDGKIAYKKIKKESKAYAKPIKIISSYLSETDALNNNYPKMIEDFVVPEIFFESIKNFIKTTDNKVKLSSFKFEKFLELRMIMKRSPIMEVADAFFDKAINNKYSFKNLNVKYVVALKYAANIKEKNEKEMKEYKVKYPMIIDFLKEF